MNNPTQTLQTTTDHTRVTTPATLEVFQHHIDESFHSHVAGGYWEWLRLFDSDSASRIRQHPALVLTELAWARQPAAKPPVLVVCHDAPRTVGAAVLVPKAIAGEKKFGPAWDLQGYRLAGNRLLGSSDEHVQSRLLDAIAHQLVKSRADFLLVEDVDDSDPLLNLVERGSHGLRVFKPGPFQKRHRIEMPASLDEYLRRFATKTRNTLKRKIKKFGDCRLERISQPDQIPLFLSAAHEISKNSWQSDLLGLRVRNTETELELLTLLASQEALRSYVLWKDDSPVSFCVGTQFNGVFDYEEVGYHRDFGNMSPGQILVMKMIEDLLEEDTPRLFDFGGGDAEYKRQFSNLTSESGHVWLLRPGIRSRIIESYLAARRLMGQTLRAGLSSLGVLDRVRQLTRRGLRW